MSLKVQPPSIVFLRTDGSWTAISDLHQTGTAALSLQLYQYSITGSVIVTSSAIFMLPVPEAVTLVLRATSFTRIYLLGIFKNKNQVFLANYIKTDCVFVFAFFLFCLCLYVIKWPCQGICFSKSWHCWCHALPIFIKKYKYIISLTPKLCLLGDKSQMPNVSKQVFSVIMVCITTASRIILRH